jgi:2-polyprenyl-3-methyl-5-hydroxy-6-metoxy-1,4-benzoquinol methylase
VIRWIWRHLPRRLRTWLVGEVVRAESEGDPAESLRALFAAQDALELGVSRTAMRHGGGLHPRHRLTEFHRYVVERVRDGERVLDVGCGLGAVAHSIAEARDARVVGIDEDPRAVQLAQQRFTHPRLEFRVADARRELPEGQWEVVVLSHVLEHLEHRRDLLHRLCAQVSPQRLVILLPLADRAWTVPLRRELGVRWMSDDTHQTELTREGWLAELTSAGLAVVHDEVRWGELWCEAVPRR